jgi:predicted trehalose synthase
MLRSLDYASHAALTGLASGRGRMPGQVRTEDLPRITPWVNHWQTRVTTEFLTTYLAHPGIALLLPKSTRGTRVLLDAFLTERCLVDLAHELRDRPDWLPISMESTLAHLTAAVPDRNVST